MTRGNFDDIAAFVLVAKELSFTKAAAQLGVTPSALSQNIRALEERLGLQLLNRTTRSVSTTEIGQRLLGVVATRYEEIEAELLSLRSMRNQPTGTVRITASEYAAEIVLWPRLVPLLQNNPAIKIEIFIDNGFTDIAAERFDAGVRLGESVEQDMIAVRISPDSRLIAVATPAYFQNHGKPRTPRDLIAHSCVNLRLGSSGTLYAWEFAKGRKKERIKVDGQVIVSSIRQNVQAAIDGFGIALVPEDSVQQSLASGQLEQVLDDWCQPFTGFHLYFPKHRQKSPALKLVVETLRFHS